MITRLSFDDFDIHEVIGAGTVGTIYRVTHRESQQQYALKLLSLAISQDRLVVARFEREIMILAKLDHPNIIRYFGHGRHKGQMFYVMEFVPGGTLKQVLERDGHLTWQEAAECGRQIAAALQHAHNHGIIHRDLKPGNVFLADGGILKLGDFGIARDLKSKDLTDAGLTVGTYSYMAPELVRGERAITGQVDLYALGCLLFELCVGRPPFVGDNFPQIFDQHLNSSPPRLSEYGVACPEPFEKLVAQLLEKDPNDRPFNARAVQGVLGELLDVQTTRGQTSDDRSAVAVRLPMAKDLLQKRMQPAAAPKEVSWIALSIGFASLAILVAILALATR